MLSGWSGLIGRNCGERGGSQSGGDLGAVEQCFGLMIVGLRGFRCGWESSWIPRTGGVGV